MMKLTNIQYNFNEDGETENITVSMQHNESPNYISASVQLTADDVTDGSTLDDLTRKRVTELAHAKIVKIVGD